MLRTRNFRLLTVIFIFFILFVLQNVTAANEDSSFIRKLERRIRVKRTAAQPGNANEYLDELLNNTRELIYDRGYDPLDVGEVDICSSCVLEGLTSIKRTGDTTLIQSDDNILLETNIGFEQLRGRCECSKKVLFIRFRGRLRANLDNLAMRGTIRTNTNGPLQPVLQDFGVTNMGKLDLQWEGKGFLAFISEAVFNLFKNKFKRHAQNALPRLLRSAIENNLHRLGSLSGP